MHAQDDPSTGAAFALVSHARGGRAGPVSQALDDLVDLTWVGTRASGGLSNFKNDYLRRECDRVRRESGIVVGRGRRATKRYCSYGSVLKGYRLQYRCQLYLCL